MNKRHTVALFLLGAVLVAGCADNNSSTGKTKNSALTQTVAPTITGVDSGDGSLTVHVALPSGITPNRWFYQVATSDPNAANPYAGGTETVANPQETILITGLTNGATYTVRVAHWDGEVSTYASASAVVGSQATAPTTTLPPATSTTTATPTTTPVTTIPPLACALGGDCKVGDIGPGGGTVFFDAGSAAQWGRYLEVAPSDLTATQFGCFGTTANGKLDGIGDGKKNSDEISYSPCGPTTAARVAYTYTLNGATGWYLPSKSELNELCKFARKQTTGDIAVACTNTGELRQGFAPTFYWSSTESDNNFSWYQSFTTGQQLNYGKPTVAAVRAIRAFTNANGVTVATTTAPLPCKRGGTCKVGDTGPGGGIVFYDAGSVQSWGQYMEITAAPIEIGSWGCNQALGFTTSTARGTGQANTTKLAAAGCTAAVRANDYVSATGFDDWFLPSDSELLDAASARAFSGVSSAWSSSDNGCMSIYCFARTRTPEGADGNVGRISSSNTIGTYGVRAFTKVG